MSLATAITDRLGGSTSQRLIQLTNDDTTATTINSTVLAAACADAQAEFQRITGIALDDTNTTHIAVAMLGVLYFLENYKGRSSAIMDMNRRSFYSACSNIRECVHIQAATNSLLNQTNESVNARPDMDRDARGFKSRQGFVIEDVNNYD